MSSKMPPVPPDQRSPNQTGSADPVTAKDPQPPKTQKPTNLDEQGQPGNIHQNTTNQGHQQDR